MSPDPADASPPALPLVPTDVWRQVVAHLDITDKQVAQVSRQFLAAWRSGVLGVYVHIPCTHAMAFLLDDRFATFPHLKFVAMDDSDACLARDPLALADAQQRPGLSLRLNLSTQVRPRQALELLAPHPWLARLVSQLGTLAGCGRFDDVWALVAALPSLARLKLTAYADLGDESLRRLATRGALRHLTLTMCQPFSGEGLAALMGPDSAIESLALLHTSLAGEHLRHLAGSPRLARLSLAGAQGVAPAHLAPLGHCPALTELLLREHPHLNAEGLRVLCAGQAPLQRLDLSYCPDIDDTAVLALAPLRRLRHLVLMGCARVTLDAVAQLAAQLPELSEVSAHHLAGYHLALGPDRALHNANGQPVLISGRTRTT